MNTQNMHDTLIPERWLLAVDAAHKQVLQQALYEHADAPPLAAWRLQYGLVQFVAADDLAQTLRQALDEGCPAVHIHTTIAEASLDTALQAAKLAPRETRLVELQTWNNAAAGLLSQLQAELARPDAWIEVAWRLTSGANFPVLTAPGHPGSEAGYREAFRAWRADRLRQGDSGSSPFEHEDDPLEASTPTIDQGELFDDGMIERAPLSSLPTIAYGRVTSSPGNKAGSPGMLHASASGDGIGWIDVATWHGHTLAPGGGKWAYVLRLQRLSNGPGEQWFGARVFIEWDADVAETAKRRSHRICLLPRLQKPVLLTMEAGSTAAPVKGVPRGRLETWPQTLEGTPLTVLVLP